MEFIVSYPDIVEKLITSINVNDNKDESYDVKCRVASSICDVAEENWPTGASLIIEQ